MRLKLNGVKTTVKTLNQRAYIMPVSILNSRFRQALCAALILHAIGIFSIGYTATQHNRASSMEVTLASFEASKADDDADFYAPINQQGAGTTEQKKQLTKIETNNLVTTPNLQKNPTNPLDSSIFLNKPDADLPSNEGSGNFNVILSNQSDHRLLLNKRQQPSLSVANNNQNQTLAEQIVSLNHQISLRSQTLAKSLKKRTITTMSTKSHQDAAYLEDWRKRIVSIGNIHYPKAANELKIYGKVRLLIAMRADGQVKSIEILESSGKKILDHSAVKIIRLAAPFAPFSAQMRKNTEILEIIRTIEFEKYTLIY